MLIPKTFFSGFQCLQRYKQILYFRFSKVVLALCAVLLVACASSEELEDPSEHQDNRILGLKIEQVQFSTKRPTSKVNPHDETRLGTSVTIPLGFVEPDMMPPGLEQEAEGSSEEIEESLPLENF